MSRPGDRRLTLLAALLASGALLVLSAVAAGQAIQGSATYRPEVVGQRAVVATGRHFAAEAGMRMLARGGNAVDAGVAATFAAAVTEISHFGLGGEAPILIYLGRRREAFVINGQGPAPAAATADHFRRLGGIPANGPVAGTVPAAVDALTIALADFGTLTLADVLAPAIELADGFPWYEFLSWVMTQQLRAIREHPSGARAYLQGPEGGVPVAGSLFRQPALARTLRGLVEAEKGAGAAGRADAIRAARDRFHGGDIGRAMARSVQEAGGLLTAEDVSRYQGRLERPVRGVFRTRHGTFEVMKAGFWSQGPMLLQALALLEGTDLARMGHNSTEYVHTVTEALKLALADRDAFYGDPDYARVPAIGLLAPAYAAERRRLIEPLQASLVARPGDPWRFEPRAGGRTPTPYAHASRAAVTPAPASERATVSPDTTTINVADAEGNLFSASPSSGWFFGGVFIAGDTGVPMGNRMQAFVLDDAHPNVVEGGKRPRTTLSPTIVLRDGEPYVAFSSPGGDSQDQQALQLLLNLAVFGMRPQEAIEAPRFTSHHHERSFGRHEFRAGILEIEDRVSPGVIEALRKLGHRVEVVGPFMMDTGIALAGFDARHRTVFGAADVRRQRFVAGW